VAYQGARGNGVENLINDMLAEFPVPDTVLLLDVSPSVSIRRIADGRGENPNEFERVENLESVRRIFHQLSERLQEIHTIDAHRDADAVFQDAAHILLQTALKRRCAKSYDCDVFYCSFRENGECRWALLNDQLRATAASR
jgi:thymidylate kinase